MVTTTASAQSADFLAQAVRDGLRKTHHPALRRLSIHVSDEALIVQGQVRSYHQLQVAVSAVHRVSNGVPVELRIAVD